MPVNYTNGQCWAIKKNGEQCLNNQNVNSLYCGPHQNHTGRVFVPADAEVANALAKSLAQQSPATRAAVEGQIAALTGTQTEKENTMSAEEYTEQFWAEIDEDYDTKVGITGSRSLQTKPADYQRYVLEGVREHIQRWKSRGKKIVVLTGMAEGFDACAAKAAQLEEVDYIAVVPSPSYGEYYWGQNSLLGKNRMSEFNDYLAKAKHVIYVCDDHMYGKANFERNQHLVNHASGFLAYNLESRGTKDCVERAKKKGLIILEIKGPGE